MTWGAMDTAGLGLDIRFHGRISTKSSLPCFLPLVQAQAAIGRASGPGRPIAPIPFQLQFLYQFGNRNRPYYLCSVQLVHKPPCSFSRSVTHQDSNCWEDLDEQGHRTSFPGSSGGFRRWHCSKGSGPISKHKGRCNSFGLLNCTTHPTSSVRDLPMHDVGGHSISASPWHRSW